MTFTRYVQQSAFPETRNERATGPVLTSVFVGTNAELMAAMAPLYLDGDVLDTTYGRGHWWTKIRPAGLTAHDLHTIDGVDFRALPHDDDQFDVVVFDPPYIPHHSPDTSTAKDFVDRFGTARGAATTTELFELHRAGVAECARVLRPGGWLITKCNDFCNARNLQLGHVNMIEAAHDVGLRCHDLIVHATGTGPGVGAIVEQHRTARAHSYLIVFRKPRRRTKAVVS